MRSASTKSGCAKSISSSDSGVENSNMRPVLEQPVEAFLAQVEQLVAQRLASGCASRSHRKQRVPARTLRLRSICAATWSTVSRCTCVPQFGQYVCPTRANSRRRKS